MFPKTFQPWKMKFPREEKKFSKGGNFPFHRWKIWASGGQLSVLFLKKVPSWEGVTEMVHGLFLLVL